MSVNGVTPAGAPADRYSTYQAGEKKNERTDDTVKKDNGGVIYEQSQAPQTGQKTYTQNAELVAKMKADANSRTAQLKGIVEQMISSQGKTLGKTDSIWSFLAGGDFSVDPAVKAQAQADIAEDGYWGVNKTSDRIIDFATALTGGNPDKIEEMRDAFDKGFKAATKTWGDKLPDISQKTYDAVMEKFDKLAQQNTTITDETMI